jgi:methylmalonyl-CoA/ethylmalonyl-CoA epimerase
MKVHHIGYAVKDIESSLPIFKQLGFTLQSKCVDDHRNIEIAFINNGSYLIELIAPLSEGSPVDNILQKNGPTPYHLCYEVPNLEEAIRSLKHNGWFVIKKRESAIAIENKPVVFLHKAEIGIIELVENSKGEQDGEIL